MSAQIAVVCPKPKRNMVVLSTKFKKFQRKNPYLNLDNLAGQIIRPGISNNAFAIESEPRNWSTTRSRGSPKITWRKTKKKKENTLLLLIWRKRPSRKCKKNGISYRWKCLLSHNNKHIHDWKTPGRLFSQAQKKEEIGRQACKRSSQLAKRALA